MHLMIDLETLSTHRDAAILQIGWALFNLTGAKLVGYYPGMIHVDPQSCIDKGMRVDWDTVKWWVGQKSKARKLIVHPPLQHGIKEALHLFTKFIPWDKIEGVWSHGATFDIPILENAYQIHKITIPWSYHSHRDTRTLFALTGTKIQDTAHIAKEDAITQAGAVQMAYASLRNQGA